MFVTVFDDYPLTEKLGRITQAGVRYKDYDVAYQDLPIAISGLRTVYADLSGAATFVQPFAPILTPVADGDALSSVLWDVADGTITVGSATTQNITVSFPNTTEHRWVSLSVTGTNGVTITFRFQVYTPDIFSSSDVIKLDYGNLTISGTLDNGWSGSVAAWADFSANEILNNTRVAIVTSETYDIGGTPSTTPIQTNVALVGLLTSEDSGTTPDAKYGEVQNVGLQITGLGTILQGLKANKQNIADVASPSEWGDIDDPTPFRILMQHLAYDTTALSVLPIEGTDLSGFVFAGQSFHLLEKTVGANLEATLKAVNGEFVAASDGTIGLYRNANYQGTTDRNALDTIFNFDYADKDYVSLDSLVIAYKETNAQALSVGAVYNTTKDEIVGVYEAKAPAAEFGSGYSTADLPGQVLVADSDEDTAKAEIAQRCANDLAYRNPKWHLSAKLPGGFWWRQPALHQWDTHTIPADSNPRGRAFTTAERWLLIEINLNFNGINATVDISASWFIETTSTGAGLVARRVPIVGDNTLNLPPYSPYNLFPDDPLALYPNDNPNTSLSFDTGLDPDVGPYPPGHNQDSAVGSETLNVNMLTGTSVSTTRASTLGETYTVEVDGFGTIYSNAWAYLFDFLTDDGGFAPVINGFSENNGIHTGGVGWEDTYSAGAGGGIRSVGIGRSFVAAGILTNAEFIYDLTNSGTWDGGSPNNQITLRVPDNNIVTKTASTDSTGNDKSLPWTGSESVDATRSIELVVYTGRKFGPADPGGSATIKQLSLSGTGTNPITGLGGGVFGDAFYRNWDVGAGVLYPGTEGLNVNGARPSGIPPFSGSHVYQFTVTGTGSPLSFNFNDSDYSNNLNNVLRVKVSGPNMGVTA
jgi:hypothetical protein